MTDFSPAQRHTGSTASGWWALLALAMAGSGACWSSTLPSSTDSSGQGGATSSSTGFDASVSVGTGYFCMSPQECSDGNPCTIDVCDSQTGQCTHSADPCLTGQYCEPAVGCVDASPCATTADCEQMWMGDACKTSIACDLATSLCTFAPSTQTRTGIRRWNAAGMIATTTTPRASPATPRSVTDTTTTA